MTIADTQIFLCILLICFRCNLRFPSTNIRLYFQSLVDEPDIIERTDLSSPPLSNSEYRSNSHVTGISDMKPLNISIPQAGGFSTNPGAAQMKLINNYHNHSPPSPTGTIRYVQ